MKNQYIYLKDEIFPPMPFDIKLSLDRVFQFWEEKVANGAGPEKSLAKNILEEVSHLPELRDPISDIAVIEKYDKEIGSLLSAMFPEILTHNEIKAASLPFFPVFFNMTQRLTKILENAGPDFKLSIRGFEDDQLYLFACVFLIGVYYHIPVNIKQPIFFDIPDQRTGVVRHYRALINADFTKINPKEHTKELTPDDIQLLIDNSRDMELWKKMIPPGSYEFEGIALVSLYDQTEDEALSGLKQLLLESDALHSDASISKLQTYLAQYLGIEKVNIGFEAYDADTETIKALHGATRTSKLLGEYCDASVDECFCDASFETLIEQKDSFAISNVKELKDAPSPFIKRMYDQGVGSFIVSPLKYNDEIIAFIELTSASQGVLNSMVATKLRNVLPMFTVAVSRAINQHETELEAIVQDRFTSIHPAVSWKFTAAAEKIFKKKIAGQKAEVDEISFNDVYPLYGQFDIRGSSDARNSAIQSDIMEQLRMAAEVLNQSLNHIHLPISQQLLYRIRQYQQSIGLAIKDGDEVKVLDFLRREIDPVLEYFLGHEMMMPWVKQYREAIDPGLGVVYQQRKKYENTVTMINEQIAAYIDQQQVYAQQMFPHYFEKYKTDGVEFNAYIGQSLLQSGTYFPLHLKNLRLWQLLMMSGVENLHHMNKHEFPMSLDITSLVLVHSNPLAIRFRMDEKRFDVDGAYNIRYEILKKRIDKAYIKGTTERLTQPGKLSIVYTQDWEADEYLQYIQYLQSIEYLDHELERVELEDLQGTAGLQAFRVGYKYEVAPEVLIREMMQEVES